MGNRTARYDSEYTLSVIRLWFKQNHENKYKRDNAPVSLEDLFQSYHRFTASPSRAFDRMDIHTFAKCLVACKILDMGGYWELRPNYTPKRYEITRATA